MNDTSPLLSHHTTTLKSTFRHIVDHPHCTTTQTESACFGLYNTDSPVTSLQHYRAALLGLGIVLCIIIDQHCLLSFLCQPNIPKFRGEYFALSKHCSHKWLWEILYMRSTHSTQVCIPCNSGGIISNLLLSRAYFPHLISAKAKKASASLRKPSRSGRCWLSVFWLFAFAEVRPRSEVNTCGSNLTLGSHTGACGNVA